jgi:hypothetical protein
MILCPNCQKRTGHKRALGFGTFFAVLLTAGFWLLAIPFYPKRCITCGLTKGASVPWYLTWRVAALVLLVFAGISVLVETNGSRPTQTAYTAADHPSYTQQATVSTATATVNSHDETRASVNDTDKDDHEFRADARIYSVALIAGTMDIPAGTEVFAQGRLSQFGRYSFPAIRDT